MRSIIISFLFLFIFLSTSIIANPIIKNTESVIKVERPNLWDKLDIEVPIEYRKIILFNCVKYNIPIILFVRHLYRESKFNPNAINYNYKINKVGKKYIDSIDEGIGQQNSKWHKEFVRLDNNGIEFNPRNPYEAIPVIAHHLYRMYKITNNWKITIAGYNCGLSRALTEDYPAITKAHIDYVFRNTQW